MNFSIFLNLLSIFDFLGSNKIFGFIFYIVMIFVVGGIGRYMYVSTVKELENDKFENYGKIVLELIMNPNLKARELKIEKKDAKRLDELLKNDKRIPKLRYIIFLFISVYVVLFSEIVVLLYPAENIKIISIICTLLSALCSIRSFILRGNNNNILLEIAVEFYTVTQFFINIFKFGILFRNALFLISLLPIYMFLKYISKKVKVLANY